MAGYMSWMGFTIVAPNGRISLVGNMEMEHTYDVIYFLAPKNMVTKKGHGLYNPYLQVKNGMQERFTDVPECLGKNVIQDG